MQLCYKNKAPYKTKVTATVNDSCKMFVYNLSCYYVILLSLFDNIFLLNLPSLWFQSF